MRIPVAVVVIVIVGISDDSIADERILRITRNTGANIDLDRSFVNECVKNGGPNAASIVETKIETALDQLFNDLDLNGTLKSVALRTNNEQNFFPLFTYLCGEIQHFEKFTTAVGEAAKTCFDAETKQSIDILHDLSNNITRYICDHNIDDFVKFMNTGGFLCLAMNREHILNCTRDMMGDSREENSSTINTIDSDDKNCIEGTDIRECMVTEMKKCGNSANEEFVRRFIDYSIQPICENSEVFKKMVVGLAVTGSETSFVPE